MDWKREFGQWVVEAVGSRRSRSLIPNSYPNIQNSQMSTWIINSCGFLSLSIFPPPPPPHRYGTPPSSAPEPYLWFFPHPPSLLLFVAVPIPLWCCYPPLSFPGGRWGTVTWSTQKFLLRLIVLLCR